MDAGQKWASGSVIETIARLCRSAVTGRSAARILGAWTRRFELSEAEFQLLWRLRSAPIDGRDQRTLAGELAFSPAQVSATVERLRGRGLIVQRGAAGDRRRHLWELSGAGSQLIAQMLVAVPVLEDARHSDRRADADDGQEAAA